MDENLAFASPAPSVVGSGLRSQIIEERPRICPLCSSEVKLFFIHFNEKLLMCENTECEFPFGCEELQFVRVKHGEEMSDSISVHSRRHMSPTNSVSSTTCMSDIERLNRLCESDDSEPNRKQPWTINKKKTFRKSLPTVKNEIKTKKGIADLKDVALELSNLNKQKNIIKKDQWIKNLMHIEDYSGFKMVKPEELKAFSKTEESKRELKIDIGPGSSGCMSSIKIEIANLDPGQSRAGT